jgi:hypothetical protein
MAVPRVWLQEPRETRSFAEIEMIGGRPASAELRAHRITALRIDPHPEEGSSIPESAYVLQLRIEELPIRLEVFGFRLTRPWSRES